MIKRTGYFLLLAHFLFSACNSPNKKDRLEVVVGRVDSISRVLSARSSYKLYTFYHFTKNDTIYKSMYKYCCDLAYTATYWPGDSVQIVYNWDNPKKSYIVKPVFRADRDQ